MLAKTIIFKNNLEVCLNILLVVAFIIFASHLVKKYFFMHNIRNQGITQITEYFLKKMKKKFCKFKKKL